MPFETLKQSNLKRDIIIGVFVVLIISAVVLNFTRAKYRSTASVPIVNSVVNYSRGDIIVSAYYNNELLETFPTKDSGYTVESITCDNDATATFDEDKTVTKGTKCNIYFVDQISAKDYILANVTMGSGTPNFANTSCSSGCDEATVGVYTAEDNDGTSYYFRGDVTNNWVKFGGYYWRIIRVNGNGTIRLIYNGTTTSRTGEGTQIGTSAFNSSYDYSYYVGLSYSTTQHGKGTRSTILTALNNWYNGLSTLNKNYIDSNAGFCSDRVSYSDVTGTISSWAASGSDLYYAPYVRLVTNKAPSFLCGTNDILNIPVGLITADEVSYAGGTMMGVNKSYYLYTGQTYWTMSPYYFFSSPSPCVLRVTENGWIYYYVTHVTIGIRPVINISKDVTLTGSGASSDPFIIEGVE